MIEYLKKEVCEILHQFLGIFMNFINYDVTILNWERLVWNIGKHNIQSLKLLQKNKLSYKLFFISQSLNCHTSNLLLIFS